MRDTGSPTAPAQSVVSKEDRIREFITTCIARQTTAAGSAAATTQIQLIARSPESPVARAVALVAAGQTSPLALQVIFFTGASNEPVTATDCDVSMYADAVAVIDNVRFMDMHEQLIVGGSAVWFGDSMRREPTKRDAFESFHRDNAEARRNAQRAFGQLWSHAAVLDVSRAKNPVGELPGLAEMPAALERQGSAGEVVAGEKPN